MKRLAYIGVVAVLVLGAKFYKRSSDGCEVLADVQGVLAALELAPEAASCLEASLERVHPQAFDACYESGGRRRAATMDHEAYLDWIFKEMAADCAAQDPELAEYLALVRANVVLE